MSWCVSGICLCLFKDLTKVLRNYVQHTECRGDAAPQYHVSLVSQKFISGCAHGSGSPLDTCHASWWLGDAVGLIWLLSVSSGMGPHSQKRWLPPPPPLPSRGNHFAAVMALLINHHKLHPRLRSCVCKCLRVMWNVSCVCVCVYACVCVCYRDAPWILSGVLRSKPWSNPPPLSFHDQQHRSVTLICWLSMSGKTQTGWPCSVHVNWWM